MSLFLSGRETVCSAETAQRIRAAVAELNYLPVLPLRGARKATSRTIGVCVPSPLDFDLAFENSFFADTWSGIAREADRENYCLLQFPLATRTSVLCESYMMGKIEGVILFNHDKERAASLASQGVPVLIIAASHNIPPGCSNAYADDSQTAHVALTHLWELNHRRIAHIAGPVGDMQPGHEPQVTNWRLPSTDDVAILRLESYSTWLVAREAYDPDLIFYADAWGATNADEYIMRIKAMAKPPTAIFCANDRQAVEIVDAAQRLGVRVPEELSVIGVDNSVAARDCRPPLTSVAIPLHELGRQGLRALLNMVTDTIPHEYRVKIPVTTLALRCSTAIAHR